MFGSLLDRSAGFFRFGPSNSSVPDQRRYLPGTNVLETTWHTPTGWMTVEDLLVVGPAATDERRERYRRVPGDTFAQGTLLRIATCYSGRVEVQLDCLPLFDYGLNAGEWSYDGTGYEQAQPHARRPVARAGEQHAARHPAACARTGARCCDEGESAFVALSWDGQPPTSMEEAQAQLDTRPRVLARLAQRRRASPTTGGARTSSAARWRSRA